VILLHIGTNSLDESPDDVEEILDQIDQYEADYDTDITVVLAKIINQLGDSSTTTTAFNNSVEAMAMDRVENPSNDAYPDKIIVVDMEDGAGIDYSQDTSEPYEDGDMIDNLHPNASGYEKMANVWLNGDSSGSLGLVDLLPVCGQQTPTPPDITSTPVTEAYLGHSYSYDVEASGFPAPTYTLVVSPTGMTINESMGLISWAPTALGDFDVTVQAVNSAGTDDQSFSIQVTEAPPCPASMVHYWKLDETAGTAYADTYGSLDASCSSCPTPSSGQVDGAQDFDGSADRLYTSSATNPTAQLTAMAWVNPDDLSGTAIGDDEGIISKQGAFILELESNGDRLSFSTYLGGAHRECEPTAVSIPEDQWTHVAATWDGGVSRVYVDGAEVGSCDHPDGALDGPSNLYYVGFSTYNPGRYFDGELDEVAVFNQALSPSEIEQYYQNGLSGLGDCAEPTPSIELEKVASGPMARVGDVITYTYTVENTGGVSLDPVTLVDDQLGTLIAAGDGVSLTVGEEITVEENYLVTADDLPGPIVNEAIATGRIFEGDPVTDTESVSVSVIQPAIALSKSVDPEIAHAGDDVTFEVLVSNLGDVSLTDVTVDDGMAGCTLSGPTGDVGDDGVLATDEIWSYTCTVSVGAVDIENTATVEAIDPLSGQVEAEDTANVDVIHPAISMTKTAERPVAYVGDEVTFSIVITNAGDVDLVDVEVEDGLEGCTLSGPDGDDGDDVLTTDEVWGYQCALNVGMLDVENTATAEAIDPVGDAVTAEATASVEVINPDITIEKTAAPATIYARDPVTYTYLVSNPGDDPLGDVVVSDDKCAPVTLIGGDTNGDDLLDVGETWTYQCATSLSVDTTNTATVTGDDPIDGEVRDEDTASVDVINPDIALEKTADATTIYAGDTVTYTYVVTNPGDDPLSSVSVSDDKCAPVSGPSEISGDGDDLLDPGEVWQYTCATALTEDTINIATATGVDSAEGTVSDADAAQVDVISPEIALEKTADATMIYAGDAVTYTYVVTNPGDDPLSSVSLSDDKCAPVDGPSEISGGGDGLLDPGEVWEYLCTTTLSESTVNTATVAGVDSAGGTVEADATASVTVISPSISLSKIASAEVITAGDVVTYTYTVTNTGDNPLTGVVVSDDKCAPVSGPVEARGNADSTLDPDEVWVYVCSTSLEENTTNTGMVTGTDSLGNPVTDADTASVLVIAPAPEEHITYLPLVARNQVLTPTQIALGLYPTEACVRRGGLIRCP
jgi:uncharacterized repeat protein (TIGR01451 family)